MATGEVGVCNCTQGACAHDDKSALQNIQELDTLALQAGDPLPTTHGKQEKTRGENNEREHSYHSGARRRPSRPA